MKAVRTVLFGILGCAPLAWGDDVVRPAAVVARPRTVTPEVASPGDVARPVQAVPRGTGPVANPYYRPVNPMPGARTNVPALARRSPVPTRPIYPLTTPVPRTTPPTVNQQPPAQATPAATRTAGVTTNGPGRGRAPRGTGNELSFAQAQAQCTRQPHDRQWWCRHYPRIIFYCGGFWYWNAGWWLPAWGYDPFYSSYIYSGPIYGYGALQPGDVTAQVQQALAQAGYYYGPIDGVLGPETRDAILRFQTDHGLAATAAIDEPTLDSLGLT